MTACRSRMAGSSGVTSLRDGEPVVIRARRGVLLATGGFERNDEMRQRYQRAPIGDDVDGRLARQHRRRHPGRRGSRRCAGTDGRGLVGAVDPARQRRRSSAWPSAACRARIFVNAAGERFVNEAAPYVDAVHAMYDKHTEDNPHIPCWMITDQRYRNRYVFTGMPPRKPLPRRWLQVRGRGQGRLARGPGQPDRSFGRRAGQDREKFNEFAKAGKDTDFGRGDSAYDHYYGDPNCKPNPNLAPLASRRITRSRSCPATSALRAGCAPTSRPGCCAPTAASSTACMRRATPARW